METLKRLPKFLELLPEPWPESLKQHFGSLRSLASDWDAWWEGAKHHFTGDPEPIPVQVVSSEADYRLRDPEAEADGDQITVVINLWYSKKVIHDAIDDLLDDRRAHWPTGDVHEDWLCEDFIVRAYRHPEALDNIYNVMKLASEGKSTQQISALVDDDESSVRRKKKKGEHLLKMLAMHVFPEVEERRGA